VLEKGFENYIGMSDVRHYVFMVTSDPWPKIEK